MRITALPLPTPQLFREYALVDLKHYKSGAIAMRWRTEDEVLERRGELTCGGLRCEHHRPVFEADEEMEEGQERPLVPARLAAFQLDFAYEEDGPQRALVKAILCDSCARKLSYKRRKDKEAESASDGDRGDRADRSRRRSRSPRRRRSPA